MSKGAKDNLFEIKKYSAFKSWIHPFSSLDKNAFN